MNRLAREKSPYLLQHKDNPVDWYPWGPEAFAKAKVEDKPILLSIGYSTCHWCHVMERESFEDASVARVMNERFVCIKLDREERPDVDRIYMTAVQAITGRGGWPLNVFLTPELKPFYGGTYFPPQPRWGQPAWTSLLGHIAELWRNRRADVAADAERLTEALTAYADAQSQRCAPQGEVLDRGFEGLRQAFDPENGGFGGAPKFPMPVSVAFLLRYWARTGKEEALGMAASTLKAMARGGIYDQLGGGFSRYSTDPYWRIPHFEKMLYDNAQLASVLVEAWQARPDAELERALRGTLGYLLRDLRHPEGGFFSAEDADSQGPDGRKSEGAFYLWSQREVEDALGPRATAFMDRYGVRPEGNAPSDPHGEFEGRNALYDAKPGEPDVFEEDRRVLFELRLKRPRPSLDDKVLASWNGLALSAFAKAARALGEPSYADAAKSAARFLRGKLYDEASGTLYHRWRDGERAVEGLADDYAFLAAGLIDLYEATLEREWLLWAESLLDGLESRFAAPAGGYHQAASGSKDLLVRVVEDSDNVEPCASSAAALSQLRLSRMLDRLDLRERAQRTLERFGGLLADRPGSLGAMLCAVDLALGEPSEVVLAGDRSLPAFRALERAAGRAFRPRQVLLGPGLEDRQPALAAMTAAGGPPRAYVCSGYACERPVSDAAELAERLSR